MDHRRKGEEHMLSLFYSPHARSGAGLAGGVDKISSRDNEFRFEPRSRLNDYAIQE